MVDEKLSILKRKYEADPSSSKALKSYQTALIQSHRYEELKVLIALRLMEKRFSDIKKAFEEGVETPYFEDTFDTIGDEKLRGYFVERQETSTKHGRNAFELIQKGQIDEALEEIDQAIAIEMDARNDSDSWTDFEYLLGLLLSETLIACDKLIYGSKPETMAKFVTQIDFQANGALYLEKGSAPKTAESRLLLIYEHYPIDEDDDFEYFGNIEDIRRLLREISILEGDLDQARAVQILNDSLKHFNNGDTVDDVVLKLTQKR